MKSQGLLILTLVLGLLVGLTGSSAGASLEVPGTYATIQAAINAAADTGDTVLVAPSSYPEDVIVQNKSIIIRSTSGAAVTAVNSLQWIDNLYPSLCSLEGFHVIGGIQGEDFVWDFLLRGCEVDGDVRLAVIGGDGDLWVRMSHFEGAVSLTCRSFHGWAMADSCTFEGPTLTMRGGGSGNKSSLRNSTLTNVTVLLSNEALADMMDCTVVGGGVTVNGGDAATVLRNGMIGGSISARGMHTTIQENTLNGGSGGIGGSHSQWGTVTISNNQLTDCGGGISLGGDYGSVTSNRLTRCGGGISLGAFCTASNNVLWRCGSGIRVPSYMENQIVGNTIVACPAIGIWCGTIYYAGTNSVRSNVLAGNEVGISVPGTVLPTVFRCNDVWGNSGGDWIGIADQTGGNGNISNDPLFCGPENGELTLMADSPCAPAQNPECGLIGADPVGCTAPSPSTFVRGDADASGELNISDPIYSLAYQFAGGPTPPCLDAVDDDDSGEVNISDPVYSLMYQFATGLPPPAPFPSCGVDPTPDQIGCDIFTPCESYVRRATQVATVTDKSKRLSLERVRGTPPDTLSLEVTVVTDHALTGLEGTVGYDPSQVQFLKMVKNESGPQMDFHSARDMLDPASVRLGVVPDFGLTQVLEPGTYRIGYLVFSVRDSATPPDQAVWLIEGRFVGSDFQVYQIEGGRPVDPAAIGTPGAGSTAATEFVFPSPYHPNAPISLRMESAAGDAEVSVYDVRGRRIKSLYAGPRTEAALSLAWDGQADDGFEVATGIYYLRARSGTRTEARSLLLLR